MTSKWSIRSSVVNFKGVACEQAFMRCGRGKIHEQGRESRMSRQAKQACEGRAQEIFSTARFARRLLLRSPTALLVPPTKKSCS